jgi:hypothetical protein
MIPCAIKIARVAVPKFGQKWFLLADFRDFRAISRTTSSSGFFAESAFLKPAKMLKTAEWQMHKFN